MSVLEVDAESSLPKNNNSRKGGNSNGQLTPSPTPPPSIPKTLEGWIDEVFYSGSMPNWKAYLYFNRYKNFIWFLTFVTDVVLRGVAQVLIY